MALASEPRLVELRERLAAERALGADFADAWQRARIELLTGLANWEREAWMAVLRDTTWAWAAAYEGRASRVWWAMTELEDYAADGEADTLRYEPVA